METDIFFPFVKIIKTTGQMFAQPKIVFGYAFMRQRTNLKMGPTNGLSK
jgi:hypothetical protein